MPSELKPCPFCGGQKITPFTGDGAEGVGRCAAFCDCCNAEGPHCDTEAEAIIAWNQRPDPATPAGDDTLTTNEGIAQTDADLLDEIAEAISDTLDMDWQPSWAAPNILALINRERAAAHAAGRAAERADVVAWLRTEAGRIDDLNRHVDAHLFADAIERGQHKEQKP